MVQNIKYCLIVSLLVAPISFMKASSIQVPQALTTVLSGATIETYPIAVGGNSIELVFTMSGIRHYSNTNPISIDLSKVPASDISNGIGIKINAAAHSSNTVTGSYSLYTSAGVKIGAPISFSTNSVHVGDYFYAANLGQNGKYTYGLPAGSANNWQGSIFAYGISAPQTFSNLPAATTPMGLSLASNGLVLAYGIPLKDANFTNVGLLQSNQTPLYYDFSSIGKSVSGIEQDVINGVYVVITQSQTNQVTYVLFDQYGNSLETGSIKGTAYTKSVGALNGGYILFGTNLSFNAANFLYPTLPLAFYVQYDPTGKSLTLPSSTPAPNPNSVPANSPTQLISQLTQDLSTATNAINTYSNAAAGNMTYPSYYTCAIVTQDASTAIQDTWKIAQDLYEIINTTNPTLGAQLLQVEPKFAA